MARSYSIDTIGGNCPVQAEGTILGGTAFYFRARGDHWSIGIGGDVVGNPDWHHEEPYDNAGWMSESAALDLIDKAINLYLART